MATEPNPNIPTGMTEAQVAAALFAMTYRECFELGLSPAAVIRAIVGIPSVTVETIDEDRMRGRVFRDWQALMGKKT